MRACLPRISRRAVLCAGLASALLAPLASAFAQAYPSLPITLIVPWLAGGSTDRHLRTLAEIAGRHLELLDHLNQDTWYRSGDECAACARETFAKGKVLIEHLGLAAK